MICTLIPVCWWHPGMDWHLGCYTAPISLSSKTPPTVLCLFTESVVIICNAFALKWAVEINMWFEAWIEQLFPWVKIDQLLNKDIFHDVYFWLLLVDVEFSSRPARRALLSQTPWTDPDPRCSGLPPESQTHHTKVSNMRHFAFLVLVMRYMYMYLTNTHTHASLNPLDAKRFNCSNKWTLEHIECIDPTLYCRWGNRLLN